MKGDINRLLKKEVEIVAHGFIYRGILIEVGIEDVYLKTETGWITISNNDVTEIREPSEGSKGSHKFVDKDFFNLKDYT